MTAASRVNGQGCTLSVNSVEVAIVDATFNVKRGTAEQSRVGKYSKFKQPGDLDISGSFTLQDVSGNHLALLMNSGANVAAETKTVIHACEAAADWTSSDVPNTPIADESTIIKEGTKSLKITCGASSLNDTISITSLATKDLTGHQLIKIRIRSPVTGAVIKAGFGETGITDNEHTITIVEANVWQHEVWDISAIADASKNAVDNFGFTILSAGIGGSIYIDDINAFKGVRVGVGSVIGIVGTGTDALGNYVTITAPACILTSGSIKFGDASTFVDGPMDFTVQDADDSVLTYT